LGRRLWHKKRVLPPLEFDRRLGIDKRSNLLYLAVVIVTLIAGVLWAYFR
jgi:hypothetical protein